MRINDFLINILLFIGLKIFVKILRLSTFYKDRLRKKSSRITLALFRETPSNSGKPAASYAQVPKGFPLPLPPCGKIM